MISLIAFLVMVIAIRHTTLSTDVTLGKNVELGPIDYGDVPYLQEKTGIKPHLRRLGRAKKAPKPKDDDDDDDDDDYSLLYKMKKKESKAKKKKRDSKRDDVTDDDDVAVSKEKAGNDEDKKYRTQKDADTVKNTAQGSKKYKHSEPEDTDAVSANRDTKDVSDTEGEVEKPESTKVKAHAKKLVKTHDHNNSSNANDSSTSHFLVYGIGGILVVLSVIVSLIYLGSHDNRGYSPIE